MIDEEAIGERFRALAGELDERRRRLWAAAEARSCGYGGIAAVARATGFSEGTIRRGLDELGSGERLGAGRVRFVGDPGQRITEDYLRLLRFFRFHADYAAGAFDDAAVAAAKELAPNLKSLSGERLRQETLRLLTARRGPEAWGPA